MINFINLERIYIVNLANSERGQLILFFLEKDFGYQRLLFGRRQKVVSSIVSGFNNMRFFFLIYNGYSSGGEDSVVMNGYRIKQVVFFYRFVFGFFSYLYYCFLNKIKLNNVLKYYVMCLLYFRFILRNRCNFFNICFI